MLKTINSDGSLKISLIGSAVPAGAIYNGGLAYAPDGSLYVKLTQGALSGQTYNGGLACTPDGALYVANSTPAASATFRRGLLCRADGAVHVSDATVATVRHDGGVPKDNAGRLFVGIPLSGLAASFDANTGITSSGGFASAWADQSGNGRNLLQATGANQPIHLPFAGTKYGWLPGVAGNYFSTPDSVAASITGDIDIRVKAALADWTPSAVQVLIAKDTTAGNNRSYLLYVNTNGTLDFDYTNNGSSFVGRAATSSVAPTVSNGAALWVRATYNSTTGKVNFYTSADGESWTALGTEQTITSGAIYDGTGIVEIGSNGGSGTSNVLAAQIYRAQIYNGINGTLAVDFDPSRWTSGSTFTASTGETWTINSTGSKPAQIVDRASLLFDGAAHWMRTGAFTLNQPETVYLVAKQVSWTLNDVIFDGGSLNTLTVYQNATTPKIRCYAGAVGNENSNLAIGTTGVICLVMNGASSILRINNTTEVTGNFGASNAGGFTLGAAGDVGASVPSNIQAYEALIYNVAHDAATRANIIRALMAKWGIA